MRLKKSQLQNIFRMFARGESCEDVAATMNISLRSAERHRMRYHDLSLAKKLRMTMLPECVTDRIHRLADDIKDIERIDALLPNVEEKTLASLLDIKRKIKDRMMKDIVSSTGPSHDDADPELDAEIMECYQKILADEEALGKQ